MKCLGCGVELQNENILNLGYTPNLENKYCMRCFKVKHYGETSTISKNKEDYIAILEMINRCKDLVIYVVDVLNIKENLNDIKKYLTNDMILVLNKWDVLPKSIKEAKIYAYLKQRYDFKEIVAVSALKNYNLELLMNYIYSYQKSSHVYVVGETNAGKSSLLNKIISNYSSLNPNLTISSMPETTLEKIDIKLNENLTLIDTPGIIDEGNIIHSLDKKYYKLLNTNKEIKPKTYQIKKNQCLIIGDFLRIDYLNGDKNSFTLYIPNGIKVRRMNSKHDDLKELSYKEYEFSFHEDLVIYGLGFVKMVIKGKIGIYLNKDVKTFLRSNLI